MPDAVPAAPAPEAKPSPVPQSSIAAELSRVYDQKVAEAEKPAGPTAIAPGQGQPAPEGPKRDDGGRFSSDKPKETKPEAKPEAKAPDKAPPPKAAPDPKDAKPAADAKAPPEAKPEAPKEKIAPHPRWKPEVQEKFTKLADADPDLAKFVLEHQKEGERSFHEGRKAMAVAERYKGLDDVLAPGRQARSLHGVDDPAFLRSLVTASDMLAKDPKRGIRMLAEQYGVDLSKAHEDDQGGDPRVRELEARLEARERADQERETQRQQHEERSRQQAAFQSIQEFAGQKDSNGQPLYPYFKDVLEDVTTVVARQLTMGQQPNLKAAYEKAIRLNDAVWMKIQAADNETKEKQRLEAEAHRIAEAKRAGFSVSGSGGVSDSVAGSIREELARQVDKHFR